jgi:hypothetical protein
VVSLGFMAGSEGCGKEEKPNLTYLTASHYTDPDIVACLIRRILKLCYNRGELGFLLYR